MNPNKCKHEAIMVADDNYCEHIISDHYEPVDLTIELDPRGYVRLINDGDRECMDHSNNFKIKYCPLCGYKFTEGGINDE